MPTYTYAGDPGRYYPSLALTVNPGDTADLDANPGDGHWTPPDPYPSPAPEPPAPAPPPDVPDVPAPATDPAPLKALTTKGETSA